MITPWMDTSFTKQQIIWLCTKAGTGKSAYVSQLALKLREKERLLATYVFRGDDKRRSEPSAFVWALAYQMALWVPESRGQLVQSLDRIHVSRRHPLEIVFVFNITV